MVNVVEKKSMTTSISIRREYFLSFGMVLETFGLRVVEQLLWVAKSFAYGTHYAKNLVFYVVNQKILTTQIMSNENCSKALPSFQKVKEPNYLHQYYYWDIWKKKSDYNL
jgi:hypothetical protein